MSPIPVDDPAAHDAVVDALRAGDAVVLPTDTVYGLAALPGHEAQLHDLKGRPPSVPIAVLVADLAQVAEATGGRALPPMAARLAEQFWPGPLTLVVPTAVAGRTVGIRCPDQPWVRAIAAAVGPIATTSANRHREPTPATAAAAAAALDGPVAVVIDGGTLCGTASTVVDATGNEPAVLREGPIRSAAILAAAQ